MMLMSFAGPSLTQLREEAKAQQLSAAEAKLQYEKRQTLSALRRCGLEHEDDSDKSCVWNEELQRVIVMDFDHATLHTAQAVPAGKKLKREHNSG